MTWRRGIDLWPAQSEIGRAGSYLGVGDVATGMRVAKYTIASATEDLREFVLSIGVWIIEARQKWAICN